MAQEIKMVYGTVKQGLSQLKNQLNSSPPCPAISQAETI